MAVASRIGRRPDFAEVAVLAHPRVVPQRLALRALPGQTRTRAVAAPPPKWPPSANRLPRSERTRTGPTVRLRLIPTHNDASDLVPALISPSTHASYIQ